MHNANIAWRNAQRKYSAEELVYRQLSYKQRQWYHEQAALFDSHTGGVYNVEQCLWLGAWLHCGVDEHYAGSSTCVDQQRQHCPHLDDLKGTILML